MKRNTVLILVVILVIAAAAVAFAVFRTPEEASAPIAAVPVIVETAQPTAAEPTATAQPAEAPTATAAAEPAATIEPTQASPTELAPAASAAMIFEIVQDQSEARFIIDEVLRGAPKRVVGVTNQVAGQIVVDPANPGATQLGTIQVNARTLATDSDFRNRAIKNQILDTNNYEFVTFEPTELVGLPESVAVGQPFSFQIVGNLTIKDTTQSVTFDVTITPVSETQLQGLATLTVPYRDFGLRIPDAPAVDTVADDVTLELEFVAVAQGSS